MRSISFFIVFLCSLTFAQEKGVLSDLLYEFKKNERVIFQNEYRLHISSSEFGYIFFTERIEDKDTNHYMIQNGVEHGPYDAIFSPEIRNYDEKEFYHFIFYKNGEKYVNMDGQIFGPYEKIGPRGGWYHLMIEDREHFVFTFFRNDKWWFNVSGKEYGPYDKVFDYYTTYNRDIGIWPDGSFYFRYKIGDDFYFNVNGKEYGPYENFDPYKNTMLFRKVNKGVFAFSYTKNDGEYVCVNGEEMGPYDKVWMYLSSEASKSKKDEAFALKYKKNGQTYIFAQGEEIGPVDKTKGLPSFQNGYSYKKDGKWIVRLSTMHMGPYHELVHFNSGGGGLQMVYCDDKNNCVVYDDGQKSRPYRNISYVKSGLDLFVYTSSRGGQTVHAFGKNYGPYDEILTGYGNIKTDDNENFYFWHRRKNMEDYFLNINGNDFGPFKKNSVPIAFYGKEFRFVRYDRKDGEYVVVSGEEYGPYSNVKKYQYNSEVKSKNDFYIEYEKPAADPDKHNEQYIVWKDKKEFGPYKYIKAGYNDKGLFTIRAWKGDDSYIFDGKKMRGPFEKAKYLPPYDTYNYRYIEEGETKVVMDRKKKKFEQPDSLQMDYNTVSNEAGDTVLYYSRINDFIELNGERIKGHAANSFDWKYHNNLQEFYWMTLDSNQLYWNRLSALYPDEEGE